MHGPEDQAGASNYVTPAKILAALTIPKAGQTYELGHPYETSMPQYGSRPYFLNVLTRAATRAPGDPIVHTEYFTGYIGQMGTQFDALSHQGRYVRMADGSVEAVFYNGFTDTELMGRTNGLGGVAALGVEQMKPFITRGVLIDIAGFKQVPTLPPAYEVTMADVRGALARQSMSETSIEQGDAVLFNYGWAVNWTNPSKYNDSFIGTGRESRLTRHRRRGCELAHRAEGRARRRRLVLRRGSRTGAEGERPPLALPRPRNSVAREPRSRRARARRGQRVPVPWITGTDQGSHGVADSPHRCAMTY